jgi:hypothetical protein
MKPSEDQHTIVQAESARSNIKSLKSITFAPSCLEILLCVICLAALANLNSVNAQVLATQPTISSSSNSYQSGSIQIDYTIGELAAVTTLTSPNHIFTQGLHQPDKFSVGIDDWNKTLYKQTIFPNPFTDRVILELESNEFIQLEFQVLDATGRLIQQFTKQKLITGKNQYTFDFTDLAAGAYFFRINSVDGTYWSTIPLIKQYK